MRLGCAGALVDGSVVPGDVEVDPATGTVAALGCAPAGRAGLAVPGFLDLQVNGFAGVDFTAADVDGYRAASTALAVTGVTGFLATIPTAAPDAYPGALEVAAEFVAVPGGRVPGARVLGVHLEGPFLSPARAGAHRVDRLRPADPAWARAVLDRGPVVMVTVAPEIDGGLALVDLLVRHGVVVSVGHSDAPAEVVHRAFDRGATSVTHLWNATRPPTARDPGPVGAALARDGVAVGLVGDLVHVDPDVVTLTLAAARGRVWLTTDAVAVAGTPGAPAGDAARDPSGALVGGATPLDQVVRNVAGLGVPAAEAIEMVTRVPAGLLGRTDVGVLRAGGPADVVVLDDRLEVTQVLVGGRRVSG